MEPSRRITGINGPAASSGWEIYMMAREMIDAGQDVVNLTVGDHDWVTPDLVLDEMARSAASGKTGYSDLAGSPQLRAAIAERVERRSGVATQADNVLVTAGAQSALFASLIGTLDPGDTALFLSPHYATYTGTIRLASGHPHPIALSPETGFQPVAADLEAAPENAKCLLVNSPNNPTGAVYSAETMRLIADFARARDLWLISDEVYETQVWEGAHISLRSLAPERCLQLGSLSKSHVMTGSRVGWLVGPEAMVSHLVDVNINTSFGIPGFLQDAGLKAILEGDAIEAEVSEVYARRRSLAVACLAQSNRLRCVASAGAMYVFLDIRSVSASGKAFAEALLRARGIAVMPGESFGAAAAGHVRIALTTEDSKLAEALKTMMEFAEIYSDAA